MSGVGKIPFWGRTSLRLAALFLLLLTPLLLWDAYSLSQRAEEDVERTLLELSRITSAVAIEHAGLIDSAHDVLLALAQVRDVYEDPETCSAFLRRVASQYARYTVFTKVDSRGFIVCSSTPIQQPIDVSTQPVIRQALDNGSFAVSSFVVGPISNKPVLVFSQPLRTDNGLAGLVNTGLNLDWLEEFLAALLPPPGMRILVFDGHGTLLAAFPPLPQNIGESIAENSVIRTALVQGQGTLATTSLNDNPVLAAFTRVENVPGGAHVAAILDRDTALAPLQHKQRQQLFVAFLALGFSLLLAAAASQRLLLRATNALARQAGRLASGDLTARSGLPHSNTDTGRLAQLMDHMAHELQQRDDAMRESDTRYRTLMQNFPGGVVVLFDQDMRYLLADGAGLRDVGLSKEQLEGRTIYELFSTEVCVELEPLYREALAGRTARHEMAFGGHYYDLRVVPLPLGANRRGGMVVTQDVTRRKEVEEELRSSRNQLEKRVLERTAALVQSNTELTREVDSHQRTEKALRESEQRLRNIIEKTPAGMSISNTAGRFEYVNPAFCDICGYSTEELGERSFAELLPAAARPRLEAVLARIMESGEESRDEWELVAADGSQRTVLANAIRIRNLDGADKIVSFMLDITQRKANEESLRLAKEQAEAANRAKSDFLATISHENRTPLNAIIGMGELLRGTDLNQEQTEYLDVLADSAQRLLHRINDVLDLSRLESGLDRQSRSPLELRHLLQRLQRSFLPHAQEKGLFLEMAPADDLPNVVLADGRKLERVLHHLLSNALKFTAAGGVTLRVSCPAAPLPENLPPLPETGQDEDLEGVSFRPLRIEVSDTGTAVPPELGERIFSAFTQGEKAMTRSHAGLGLGLTISNRLATLMGGRIELQSAPDVGNSFILIIPVGAYSS